MVHEFELFYNGKKIQSGIIAPTNDAGIEITSHEAYRRFLQIVYKKEFEEVKKFRGNDVTDSDIFGVFNNIFK